MSLNKLQKENETKTFTIVQQDNYKVRADAYKAEHKGIDAAGGPKGKDKDNPYNYNKINSPGKKLCENACDQ